MRESGTARLEEAVAAFRDALKEYTRERVPYYRDLTQKNLDEAKAALLRQSARSGPSRSAVPIDREQSFRLIPIIRSGITISLWTGANGTVG